MPLLTPEKYVEARQKYSYYSEGCTFNVAQTGNLQHIGSYKGLFGSTVPKRFPSGINLRRFELICHEQFADFSNAVRQGIVSNIHIENLKSVCSAIVYWKMSSQGGRATRTSLNMLAKWSRETEIQLVSAFELKSMPLFKIGGVRIPTATAFMRFLFPEEFGIMDSRVVGNYTQPKGITALKVRPNDGYIVDNVSNVHKYSTEYIPFLKEEADWLNDKGATFLDMDQSGNPINSRFRICDVEMALFV